MPGYYNYRDALYSLLIITLLSCINDTQQLVPEASQEGPLYAFKTFNDVTIFHYSVPKEVTRATWQFAAFMDGKNCIPREVNIHLQWGSYPVISLDNSSFPTSMNADRNNTIIVNSVTTYNAEATVIVPIDSPEPGDWYVGAYMTYWDEKVHQRGIGHKCRYSFGSVAIWQQVNDIKNVEIGHESTMRTNQPSSYYKIYIPSGSWSFSVTISNCTFTIRSRRNNSDACIKAMAIQGRTLPIYDHRERSVNLGVNSTYTFDEFTPFEESYYYLLIVSDAIVDFNVKVSISECPVRITENSPTRQWASRLNASLQVYSPELMDLFPPESSNRMNNSCARRLQLIRVKQVQKFSGIYLFQGREVLTPWVLLTDVSPIIAQFNILPLLDVGGSLKIGVHLEIDKSFMKQKVSVSVCIRRGQVPHHKDDEIICLDDKLRMRLDTEGKHDGNLLIPYPEPDTWYIGLQARCFNDGEPIECEIGEILVSLDIRIHQCVFPGPESCGHYGECQEIQRGHIHYTTCNCFGGYRGWGCTDSTNAYQQPSLLLSSLMPIASNLFFIPAIYLATKCRLYTEALVYSATMLFSSFYHACDQKFMTYCIARFEVLQYCDFFTSILAFWVTLIAMAQLPVQLIPFCHMFGVLIISFVVESDKTGLTSILIPLLIGIMIPIGMHLYRRYKSRNFKLPVGIIKMSTGLLLASTGLILYTTVETEANYQYIHSMWHMIIALSLIFLLPTVPISIKNSRNNQQNYSDRDLMNYEGPDSPVFTILTSQRGLTIEN